MFFQLVSYQAGINYLLGNTTHSERSALLLKPSFTFVIIIVNGILSILVYKLLNISEQTEYLSLFFLSLSPLASYLGIVTSILVLKGFSSAQVSTVSLQNTTVLLSLGLFYIFEDFDVILLGWFLSLAAAALLFQAFRDKHTTESVNLVNGINNRDASGGSIQSLLLPVVIYSTVLVERLFYSNTEGALAFIKFLETIATSIAFICQILFYNKSLAIIHKSLLSSQNHNIQSHYKVLLVSLTKSSFIGLMLYTLSMLALYLLWDIITDWIEVPISIADSIFLLSLGYAIYLTAWIIRDHVERFVIISGGVNTALTTALLVLLLTAPLNYFFHSFTPISVLIISFTLIMLRNIYLFTSTIATTKDSP